MKKFTAILLFLVGYIGVSEAQVPKIGIRAGVGVYNWGGGTGNALNQLIDASTVMKTVSKPGLTLGLNVAYPLNNQFELETGLNYTQRGIRLQQTFMENNLLSPRLTVNNNSHYLDLPLQLKYNIPGGLHILAGGRISYLMSNQLAGRAGLMGLSAGHKIGFNGVINDFDWGLTGGIGMNIANNVNVRALYDFGLGHLENRLNSNIFNRGFNISVGYSF